MTPTTEELEARILRRIRTLRFVLLGMIFAASFVSIWLCLAIRVFKEIFADFGADLPALTALVIGLRPGLIALSIAMPAIAIAILFIRNISLSLATLGILFVLIATIILLVIYAVFLPTFHSMGGIGDSGL